MDTMIDIFAPNASGGAFSSTTLTGLVNENFAYVPGLLSSMGLAPGQGMLTTTATFDSTDAGLRMISTTPRGAPPSQKAHVKGALRQIGAVHLSREVEIYADELLAVRARGTMNPQTLQSLIMERVDGPVGLKAELALTMEHMLLGLIDGTVVDADNLTILYDLFGMWGKARPAVINIPFSTTTDKTAIIELAVTGITRQSVKALNGLPLINSTPIFLCGDQFFDALTGSQEVIKARQTGAFGSANAGDLISQNLAYKSMMWAGAKWINYRGTDDGSTVAIPTKEARFFMQGVPGLFSMFFAPADTFETVSTLGLPYYLLNNPERQTSKRAVFELQSNPLPMCLRPASLIRLTYS